MILLYPAAGSTYNCKQQVQMDYDQYRDFKVANKGYINKSDIETMRTTHPHLKGSDVCVKYRKGEACKVDEI